jgi:hypothetical protein
LVVKHFLACIRPWVSSPALQRNLMELFNKYLLSANDYCQTLFEAVGPRRIK